MKKLLLLCSAFFMLGQANVFAQEEEDVTHYIVNAGFDEDLTFNADGSTKEIVDKGSYKPSNRSWAYMAADSSVYMWTDSNSPNWNGSDGRTHAYNGYVAQIKGWELASRDWSLATEWVYFGVLPYDLEEHAIPVADDGTGYQPVPAKPDFANGDDNKGALFLRAGWTGKASYKQTVKLPCAQYRVEYWSININPNTTSEATDLSKVTCRKDVFQEEGGSLSATEWTKHEFEFTPTSEFTIEFGYQSANAGSAGQAYVFIDGIKLYKIGEADEEELLQADLLDMCEEVNAYMDNDTIALFEGLIYEIGDYVMAAEGASTIEEMTAAIADLKVYKAKIENLIPSIVEYSDLESKAMREMEKEDTYPGFEEFSAAFETLSEEIQEASTDNFPEYTEKLKDILNKYYMSQEVTAENPADFSFLLKSPHFTAIKAEPTYEDGIPVYPAGEDYTAGTTPANGSSEGWYVGGVTGGDQRVNFVQGRVAWNLWDNKAGLHKISQDITDLPSGYYTVKADMITQPDWVHEAHVYAETSAMSVSSPFLTEGNWAETNDGLWTTLETEKILVADGKLTIGGRSQFPNANQTGWFCITNVRLYYHGPFEIEDYQAIYNDIIAKAEAMCDTMVYAADKAAFADSIAAIKGATTAEEITAALAKLSSAQATAQASINKWIGVNTGSWQNLKDSIASSYTEKAGSIAQKIVDLMGANITAADATYTTMDSLTTVLRYYRDNYIPAFMKAEAMDIIDVTAQEAMTATLKSQFEELTAITKFPTTDNLAALVDEINNAIVICNAANLFAQGGTDYTPLIINPTFADETGWTFNKTNGNTNVGSGQNYDGTSSKYQDSYNSTPGAILYTSYQTITNIPNGVYELKTMNRVTGETGAEGCYTFAIADNDTANAVFKAIHKELTNVTYFTAETAADGSDSLAYISNKFGSIFKEVWDKVMKDGVDVEVGSIEDHILNANNGWGYGWFYNTLQIEVKNHTLTIGVTTDSTFTAGHVDTDGNKCVPFTGTWFSADNYTLTQISAGDNTGWNPATGITIIENEDNNFAVRVENGAIVTDGEIYNLSGARVANGTKLPTGVYVVRSGKVAKKILVK